MPIKVDQLTDLRPLDAFFEERLPGRIPKNWEGHQSGSLQEAIFYKPDGFIQEAYENRVDGITPGNAHLKHEIESHYQEYHDRKLRNGTLFTLQLMGSGKMRDEVRAIDLDRLSIADMWFHPHPPNANMQVLVFGLCSYFEQIAMVQGDVEGMQPTYAALVSACTTTNDNTLVFARRVGQGHNKIGIIGGTLNEDEQKIGEKQYKTPDEAMASEATEELGIESDQCNLQLRAVISDRVVTKGGTFPRPVLFYDLNLKLNQRQLQESFEHNEQAHKEHSELIFVPNTVEGILEFMKNYDPSELHPPADAVLNIALERATGVKVI